MAEIPQEALVHNAVDRALSEHGHWVRLGVREAVARKVLDTLAEVGLVVVSREDLRAVLDKVGDDLPVQIWNAAARLRAALTEPEQADG